MRVGDSLKLLPSVKIWQTVQSLIIGYTTYLQVIILYNQSSKRKYLSTYNIWQLCILCWRNLKLRNDLGDEVDITVKQIEYDSTNTAQVYSNTIVVQTSGGTK